MAELYTPPTSPASLPAEPDSLIVMAGKILIRCAHANHGVAELLVALQKETGVGGWDEIKNMTVAQILSSLTVGEILELTAYAERTDAE